MLDMTAAYDWVDDKITIRVLSRRQLKTGLGRWCVAVILDRCIVDPPRWFKNILLHFLILGPFPKGLFHIFLTANADRRAVSFTLPY